jgi:hypothetical protein
MSIETQMWIEERTKTIEEYQYEYNDVYGALRKAKQTLSKVEFKMLNYYMEEFVGALKASANNPNSTKTTQIVAFTNTLNVYYRFKEIFETIATGNSSCNLCFPEEENDNTYFILVTWDYLYESTEECVTTHGDFLYVPPWIDYPVDDITY